MTISTYLSRTSVRAGGPLRTRHVDTEFATARSSYLPTQQTSRSYTTFRNAPLGTPSARFSPLGHRANVFRHPNLDAFRPNSQHRTVFSLPKTAFSVLRLPIAAAGTGAGVMAFMQYKVNEWQKEYVPDWARDAYSQASDWVNSFDMSKVQLPEFNLPEIDFSKFQFPGGSSGGPTPDPNITAALPDDRRRREEDEDLDFASRRVFREKEDELAQPAVNSRDDVKKGPGLPPPDEALMLLTKKMIEIRNLLKTVNNNTTMTLPSIVVIGSQSSGKSSVLESIVGHEFLPKGNNMVTRRPIELTLIHTPDTTEEYGEFPQLGLGRVHDFTLVQKHLTDMNLAVSSEECVSPKPIELKIYSPNVPDLTLIDLPGYIQIHNRNQPAILKEKIAELCESYIREPNIILAVCSADVDLANSEALRASRKVDPKGRRTIGVVTKMDLVEPEAGVGILTNRDYPLQLGYVGVVSKAVPVKGTTSTALVRGEDAFFGSYSQFRQRGVMVGTQTLRRRLMEVLEDHMGRSLHSVVDAVQTELEDARYQFKVHYNDRKITAESYVADSVDSLKQRFKEFAKQFGKPQVREEVRSMLEARLLDICESVYWEDARVSALAKTCLTDPYWSGRLDVASGALTKSGIGRSSVQHVVDILKRNMERLTATEPWVHHAESRQKIMDFTNELLRSKIHTTIDQVENTIKPYKFEVEVNEQEWVEGQKRAVKLLERQLEESQKQLQGIKGQVGRRKLRNAMKYVARVDRERKAAGGGNGRIREVDGEDAESQQIEDQSSPYTLNLLAKAREASHLQSRITLLQMRTAALKSRQCSTSESKSCCPEVFLSVVAEKLTYTAVMFIHVELLNEFFFQLPREIDNRLYYGLGRGEVGVFARENGGVKRHLEVMERKETLEVVMEKLKELQRKGR